MCENTLTVNACTRYPGTTASYSSNGTSVLVIFVSDVSVGFKGFKLKYSLISPTTAATTAAASEDSSKYQMTLNNRSFLINGFLFMICFKYHMEDAFRNETKLLLP